MTEAQLQEPQYGYLAAARPASELRTFPVWLFPREKVVYDLPRSALLDQIITLQHEPAQSLDQRDLGTIESPQQDADFERLASQWHRETDHLSVTLDVLSKRTYKRILTMGERVVPLILEDLRVHGGHWFEALELLTGENPAKDARNHAEASKAWLEWGRLRFHLTSRDSD